jgi:alkylation response protein AidB-like acyl-CoA dehydrogenase
VNFELSEEQELLREAARGALARHDTLAAAREALDGAALPDLWPVAVDAGWPGLLVDEDAGGAGLGVFDAMLVMQECGRRLASVGLMGHFLATFLGRGESALGSGETRAAAVIARPPDAGEGWTVESSAPGSPRVAAPTAERDGDTATVSGVAAYVPDAAGAGALVVVALSGDGPVAVLVDPAAGGVEVERVVRYDATRPLGSVRLDGARGTVLDATPERIGHAWYLAQALLAAEAIGATEAPLELGIEYAKERHAFGRPIGSYQAVKHQLVEILRGIETARSLSYYAGWAAEDSADEFALAASAARYAADRALDYGARTVIAVHGGIGNTWEHDAPLYLRRAQLSRILLGGMTAAGDRVSRELLQASAAAGTAAAEPAKVAA